MLSVLTAGGPNRIFLVGHLLHPHDADAVQRFLNADVGHGSISRRTVPMLVTWRAPDHVASTNFDDGFAFSLSPSAACGDDERLPEGMGMPGAPCTRFERHAHHRNARGFWRRVQRVHANVTRKVRFRGFPRGLRAYTHKIHG
jgi:hypothetical protein